MSIVRPRSVVSAVALAAAFVMLLPIAASAATIHKVRAGSLNEWDPAAAPGVLAWTQETKSGGVYNAFVQIGSQNPKKVNPAGTQGAMGGIDGSTLVYQQFKSSTSDIRFYDLDTGKRTDAPDKVNAGKWQFWPSLSGSLLLFGRFFPATGTRQVLVYDADTDSVTILDSIKGKDVSLTPGQVDNGFATWTKCSPTIHCQVFVQNVAKDGSKPVQVPNPGKYQYGPSVAADGTVFFARSGQACGSNVLIMRFHTGSKPSKVEDLPSGVDFDDSYVYRANGHTRVLFSRLTCDPLQADIYEVVLG